MSKSQRKKNTNAIKVYEARFFFTQHSVATEIVVAKSLAEAKRRADAMEPEDIDDFDLVEGDLWVDSVKLCTEGKSHE